MGLGGVGTMMLTCDSESNQGQKGLSTWWLFSGFQLDLRCHGCCDGEWRPYGRSFTLSHISSSLPWTLRNGCMDGHLQGVTFMPEDVWFLELSEWLVIKPSLQSGLKPVSVEKYPLDRPPAHHTEGTHIFLSSEGGMKPEYPGKTLGN